MPVRCCECEEVVAPLYDPYEGGWFCPNCNIWLNADDVLEGYAGQTFPEEYC